MKIKAYQIKDLIEKNNYSGYLVYGQNNGLVKEKIKLIYEFYQNINKEVEIIKLHNDELIEKPEKLYNEVNTFSLTSNSKLIHITNVTDKIFKNIEESISEKNKDTSLIIFEARELTPRSKIRNYFEKQNYLGTLACYYDNQNDIKELITKKFLEEKIPLTNQIKSFLIESLGVERNIIKNELEKIILFSKKKKNISELEISNCISDNNNSTLEDLNYTVCDGDLIKLDKILNQLFLEGINPILILRSVSKHFQKILFVNEKIDDGLNINESISLLKPPIFFLYLNRFKTQIKVWKNKICYKVIERIFDAEKFCKFNSQLSKIICWRTLRNISYYNFK